MPGVSQAFLVLGLINSIWSIMGVDFFGEYEWLKPFYGNFSKASLTMLQVMTTDSWTAIARPIVLDIHPIYSLYFVTYVFVNGVIMVNVVVAILLERFSSTMRDFDQEELESSERAGKSETPSAFQAIRNSGMQSWALISGQSPVQDLVKDEIKYTEVEEWGRSDDPVMTRIAYLNQRMRFITELLESEAVRAAAGEQTSGSTIKTGACPGAPATSTAAPTPALAPAPAFAPTAAPAPAHVPAPVGAPSPIPLIDELHLSPIQE
eukprot:NODE_18583_length_885_cov_20.984169.p1 GENE.NODE_18583_length_885_cov_20.984169~~NODE_18583_length_885_cov_20.984169.p1  ORF type:complete len:279 (-),score=74.34 NODE_18583_length_885_cov_20.984169:47-838(-)